MIQLNKWRITGLVSLFLVVMTAIVYQSTGFSEDTLRTMVRVTARSSIILFLMAFTASALFSLVQAPWTSWLRQNRRYLGVSFALSHFTHLVFLLLILGYFPERMMNELDVVILIVAGLGYLFLLAMTITSFQGPRAMIGERAWRGLHLTGMYLLWVIFAQTYIPMSLKYPEFYPFSILLLVALSIRIVAAVKRKKPSTGTA